MNSEIGTDKKKEISVDINNTKPHEPANRHVIEDNAPENFIDRVGNIEFGETILEENRKIDFGDIEKIIEYVKSFMKTAAGMIKDLFSEPK